MKSPFTWSVRSLVITFAIAEAVVIGAVMLAAWLNN
jgi:hypothetical protein